MGVKIKGWTKNTQKTIGILLIAFMILLSSLTTISLSASATTVGNEREEIYKDKEEPQLVLDNLQANADEDELVKLGQWDENYGEQFQLCIDGNYLYTASHTGGILKFNITQPESPTLLGAFNHEDPVLGEFLVKDDIMFKQGYEDGFEILNISNINQVEELAFIEGNFTDRQPHISGDTLVTTDENDVFLLFDISNLSSPSLIQIIDMRDTLDFISSFSVKDNILFIFDEEADLRIYNITTPISPELITIYDSPYFQYCYEPKFYDYYVYNHISNVGIQFINITDIHNPIKLAFVNETTYDLRINDCQVYQNMLYILTFNAIEIYNVTVPFNRTYMGRISSVYYRMDGIELSGEHLFMNNFWNELDVFNLTNSTNPTSAYTFEFGGNTKDVAVSGNIAVIANGNLGIKIFNITDKSNPILINEIYLYRATKVLIQNNVLYVLVNHNRIEIYNISSSGTLANRGSYSADPSWKIYNDFLVDGNYLTLMLDEDGIDIIDVSNLDHPVFVVNHYVNYFTGIELLLDGDLLYLLGSSPTGDILIFDVSDYPNSALIKILLISDISGKEIYIEDEVLYMIGYSYLSDMEYLYYYEIKRNNVYQLDGYFEIGNIASEDLVVDGNYIYFASSIYGMVVYRQSSSFLFELFIPFTNYETSQEFIFADGYIYIAAGYDGLVIYKALPPTTNLQRLFIIIGVVGGLAIVVIVALLFFRRRYRKALTKS